LIGALALATAADAQMPSGNDISDSHGNTGMGSGSLGGTGSNTIATIGGYSNTAAGYFALSDNTDGDYNTATGFGALGSNESGSYNTAAGFNALLLNSSGVNNSASGALALFNNTTGKDNTAAGYRALFKNKFGAQSTAYGAFALSSDTVGDNTAVGYEALKANTSGKNNVALGWEAGAELTTGSDNIDIGSPGVAAEIGVIRIGTITDTTSTQTATYIAGIYGITVSNPLPVYINSYGQLGTVMSSERFKTAIAPMGTNTEKLQQLRPVTFKLKTDASGTTQYGLIAEEVAKVHPELVIRDASGRIDGVRYDELAPMLLDEVQKQQKIVATQAAKIAAEAQRAAAQDAKIASLEQQLAGIQAALVKLQPKDELVAQR
jgi:hypothetical protein